ncbi:MAG: amidohydrolase [Candidatus Sumerlaeia bacterium]|nr:amidohydrolase [Candidatus Sumerlaeia bacterium]
MSAIRWVLGWILLAISGFAANASQIPADLIITHANVWTVDKMRPRAEAIAVRGERIAAVGTNAEIAAVRGSDTRVLDAKGRLVLPGFNDAHVHFVSGGCQLDNVRLKDASTTGEFVRRIAERARTLTKGEWITGGDWDEQQWSPPVLPTKELIDPVTPDNPVFLYRYDGHLALVNSVALRLAGVTAATPDEAGGVIARDANGNPTGILKEGAMGYVRKIIPPLNREQRLRGARRALAHAASLGVTSIHDMGSHPADLAVFRELAGRGELTVRIYAVPSESGRDSVPDIPHDAAGGASLVRLGGIKVFADGSLGSSTAYFFEPFADDPANRGLLTAAMLPLDKARERMVRADRAGRQLCIHAIGDQGISVVLDLFEAVARENGPRDRRFRIEHSQHVAPKDFDRYARLGVVASMQPYHCIDDGRWAEKRIGPERCKTTYAFRTFLDRGVRLAFGSDWDVAPLDPMQGIYAAVTRATLDGKNPNGWVPEQKISVAEAVEAFTLGSAYAEFQENEKGSITPGKLADLVILSDDIFTLAPERIRDVRVETTIFGGKIIWSRPSAP